jgi:hypothetical protein
LLQLDTWSQAGAFNNSNTFQKLEVMLPVPAGQQELAELLVKGKQEGKKAGSINSSQDWIAG